MKRLLVALAASFCMTAIVPQTAADPVVKLTQEILCKIMLSFTERLPCIESTAVLLGFPWRLWLYTLLDTGFCY